MSLWKSPNGVGITEIGPAVPHKVSALWPVSQTHNCRLFWITFSLHTHTHKRIRNSIKRNITVFPDSYCKHLHYSITDPGKCSYKTQFIEFYSNNSNVTLHINIHNCKSVRGLRRYVCMYVTGHHTMTLSSSGILNPQRGKRNLLIERLSTLSTRTLWCLNMYPKGTPQNKNTLR